MTSSRHHGIQGETIATVPNYLQRVSDTVSPATLTAAHLDLNENSQSQVPFSYDVYQGHDSGYQSLEQA
jgi:hypothetical protein